MDYIKVKDTWWFRKYLKVIEMEGNDSLNDFLIQIIERMQLVEKNILHFCYEVNESDFANEKYYFKFSNKKILPSCKEQDVVYFYVDLSNFELLNLKITTQYSKTQFYENQIKDKNSDFNENTYSRKSLCKKEHLLLNNNPAFPITTDNMDDLIRDGKIIYLNNENVYFDYFIDALNFSNKKVNEIYYSMIFNDKMFLNFIILLETINPNCKFNE